jgi:NhaA family Na+:H+ antiporter
LKPPSGPFIKQRPFQALRAFLRTESAGGLCLFAMAALALMVANSPAAPIYFDLLQRYVLGLTILHWINDALMALFFLLVGLEVKREVLVGQLSSWSRRALPGMAALGGMIVPAIIYLACNLGAEGHPRGWAIPAATDIAFALGVISLLASRVPTSLKVFLTALAIIDDLGAVIIIALFYTADLNSYALGAALAVACLLGALNRKGVVSLAPYLLTGALLWLFVLLSGVHATLAGVALALSIPHRARRAQGRNAPSPLVHLEHRLHPWVAFLIVPVFGFANAGVAITQDSLAILLGPVPLGIALGLFAGKQLGVFLFVWGMVKWRLADLPARSNWMQLYGVSLLCGIGFTMSLFIGLLAFPNSPDLQDAVKLGVLLGSTLSGLAGAVVLTIAPPAHLAVCLSRPD